MSYLPKLGWNDRLAREREAEDEPDTEPARVVAEHRGEYDVMDGAGAQFRATLSGRGFAESNTLTRPAVGDWVAVRPGTTRLIARRFSRSSELVRKAAGKRTEPQVVAANVDVVFVVTWHEDFNLRRIERYLTFAWDGGAMPVLVLSKADLCPDAAPYLDDLTDVAAGVPVEIVSGTEGTNIDRLMGHLGEGRTGVFVGSSGVGKSTLVNAILGDQIQRTGEVRESDARGRHVTTHRELFVTDHGILIDTPGMRELGLWTDEESPAATYGDIDGLAAACRFRDCKHVSEPGCAVRAAIDSGELDLARLEAFRKQEREIAFVNRARDAASRAEQRKQGKRFARMVKEVKRVKGQDD